VVNIPLPYFQKYQPHQHDNPIKAWLSITPLGVMITMDWYVSGPFRVRLLLGIMGVVCTSAGPFRVRMVIWDMVDRFYDRVYI
jgi:hypothetical protein